MEDASTTTKVLIYDDEPNVRARLCSIVEAAPGLQLVGVPMSAADAADLIERHDPHVFIVDVDQPDVGVELCRELHVRHPSVRCLVLTGFADDDGLVRALSAGAVGYLRDDAEPTVILRAVADAMSSQQTLAVSASRRWRELGSPDPRVADLYRGLSERERSVVAAMVRGQTNREIAHELALAETTIRNCISRVLAKLRARNRTEVVALLTGLAVHPTGATQHD